MHIGPPAPVLPTREVSAGSAGGSSADTFDLGVDGIDDTLAPTSTLHRRLPTGPAGVSFLPAVMLGPSEAPGLTQGEQLGEGGMGVVYAAEDALLARSVAVKRPRPEAGTRAANALIAEARTLAGLDHPNVVPVHALGRDETGAPILVMKRVRGQRWSDLVREGRDLDRDLGILLEVCDAVRFAHARGLLHRDIKLDNVMVGGFGEVYLMDLGCACGLDEGVTRELVGTPTCMAPEMVRTGAAIGPPTDVFLLGATLHEALTGVPRNAGRTQREVLASAIAARPAVWGPEVPPALGAVVDRACAPALAERYPTVEAFTAAVRGFLVHRQAAALATRAGAVLARLQAAVAAGDPRAETLFAECRFGFRSALDGWPGCEEAREGLAQAHAAYVPWKIRIGELDTAEALLPEVEPAAAARWGAELAGARRAAAGRAATLHSLDLSVAARERRNLAFAVLVTSVLSVPVVQFLEPDRARTTVAHVLLAAHSVLMFLAWLLPFRRRILANRVSRSIVVSVLIMLVAQVFHRVLGWQTDTPLGEVLRADCVLTGVGICVLAACTNPALMLAAIPNFAGAVAIAMWPDRAMEVFPVSSLLGTAVIVVGFARQEARVRGA